MVRKNRHRCPPSAGEQHGESKLTDAAVRDILTSPETGRALAKRYHVSESAISLVRRGKSWTHVIAQRLAQDALPFGEGAA